jgi:hypothetical protein
MNKQDFWRNFSLNRELHVSGAFIYDGMRELRSLQTFDNADQVFQVAYPLAVGFERLLKIAIVLLEYKSGMDQAKFERSLITHNHLDLLSRVKKLKPVHLQTEHHELLQILGKFYKSYRYDRFSIDSVFSDSSETADLLRYYSKHIPTFDGSHDQFFGEAPSCPNEIGIFTAKVCRKICSVLYKLVHDAAGDINLYTYELRSDSKAYKVFICNELDFVAEDLLWKEILVFLMNTRADTPELGFLREIKPLDLDPGMIPDYLQCLGSDLKKIEHIEELKELYRQIEDAGQREELISIIGNKHILIGDDDEEPDTESQP